MQTKPNRSEKKPIIVDHGQITLPDIQTKPVEITDHETGDIFVLRIQKVKIRNSVVTIIGWHTFDKLPIVVATTDSIIQCEHVLNDEATHHTPEYLNGKKRIPFGIMGTLSSSQHGAAIYLSFKHSNKIYNARLILTKDIERTTIASLPIAGSRNSVAHIDKCGSVFGKTSVLAGWAICRPGVTLWMMDRYGNKKDLKATLRFQRKDVIDLFSADYSRHTTDAGFVTNWEHPQQEDDFIAIVEESDDQYTMIAKLTWMPIPNDPVAYARFAFSVATPAESFDRRLNEWEGPAIEKLLDERNALAELVEQAPDVWQFGKTSSEITTSVVIPLYGRWDFVEHQLSCFATDSSFANTSELIYVIDDPVLITPLIGEAENLYRLYQVPFKIIWGHRNRGFSGANNFGAQIAKGENLVFLNSDAFPLQAGWIESLASALVDNPEYGLIGARLLFPDGGLQHAGMRFLFSETWGVWLNKHPLAGLDPELDVCVGLVERPAVTGACVAVTRANYKYVGGFDEGYLIGDFEDSDFCMKFREVGLKIGYLPEATLIHLERQSFRMLGDTSFRTLVVRFNAWRHSKRWGEDIAKLNLAFEQGETK